MRRFALILTFTASLVRAQPFELNDTTIVHAGQPTMRLAAGMLAPDLARIAAWGKEAGVNGIYAWCRRDDGTFEGRNFNHLDPRLEDSATGVAAGALTALLGLGIRLRQGRATGGDA